MSDVKLGTYLSGGADSSLIAALSTKLKFNERLHTWGIFKYVRKIDLV
ncbi:MAG: hypothetical protein E7216_10885 [Clostridium thermopalmarium]|nr:hypothetical protein [Clostridium thermopalmarium]